jgi:two-component system OmpR family sensor kinase
MTSDATSEPPPPPSVLRRAAAALRLLPHPARWTLQRRLVLSVVGLLALASIIIGTVSVLALQGFLVGRLDDQLTATTGRSRQVVGEDSEAPQTPGFLTLPGQRPGMLGAIITDGGVFAGVLEASGVEKPLSAAQVSQFLSVARTASRSR